MSRWLNLTFWGDLTWNDPDIVSYKICRVYKSSVLPFPLGPVSTALSVGAVVGISVSLATVIGILILIVGLVVLLYIGFKRPTSRLGLFLIEVNELMLSTA